MTFDPAQLVAPVLAGATLSVLIAWHDTGPHRRTLELTVTSETRDCGDPTAPSGQSKRCELVIRGARGDELLQNEGDAPKPVEGMRYRFEVEDSPLDFPHVVAATPIT